jgi:hypothetical protein
MWSQLTKVHIISIPPTLDAMSYQAMYVYGNHIHVASAKENLQQVIVV